MIATQDNVCWGQGLIHPAKIAKSFDEHVEQGIQQIFICYGWDRSVDSKPRPNLIHALLESKATALRYLHLVRHAVLLCKDLGVRKPIYQLVTQRLN